MNHSAKNTKLSGLERKQNWDKQLQLYYRSRPQLVKGLIYLAVSLILIAIIFYPRQYITARKYQAGEIADKTIRVLQDLEVQDLVTIAQYQKSASEQTPEVYDFSPDLPASLNQKLEGFFSGMRELYRLSPGNRGETISVPSAFQKDREDELISELGVELSQSEIDLLRKFRFSQEILNRGQTLVNEIFGRPLVSSRSLFQKSGANGIVIRNLKTDQRSPLSDFSQVRDLSEVRKELDLMVKQEFPGYPFELQKLIGKIVSESLQPDLALNQLETEESKTRAVSGVKPVYFKLKKGEVIVRKGDRINEDQWKKIEAIQNIRTPFESWLLILGMLILIWLSQYLPTTGLNCS